MNDLLIDLISLKIVVNPLLTRRTRLIKDIRVMKRYK